VYGFTKEGTKLYPKLDKIVRDLFNIPVGEEVKVWLKNDLVSEFSKGVYVEVNKGIARSIKEALNSKVQNIVLLVNKSFTRDYRQSVEDMAKAHNISYVGYMGYADNSKKKFVKLVFEVDSKSQIMFNLDKLRNTEL